MNKTPNEPSRNVVDWISTDEDVRLHRADVFESWKDCEHLLSERQWKVICLRVRDGLTNQAAASELTRAPSTVSAWFTEARRIRDEYRRQVTEVRVAALRQLHMDDE